jgi:hypothetical protein
MAGDFSVVRGEGGRARLRQSGLAFGQALDGWSVFELRVEAKAGADSSLNDDERINVRAR